MSITRSTVRIAVFIGAATFAAGAAVAQTAHILVPADKVQWGPAPPILPAGAQIAVLAGDPTKGVPYTVRLKFPANYAIPAHSHPTDENVVVTTGALTLGMGDKLMKGGTADKTLSAGGYALMPANMNHFAYTTNEETTVVLYGIGPVDFKYVNPSDDPRTASKQTRK